MRSALTWSLRRPPTADLSVRRHVLAELTTLQARSTVCDRKLLTVQVNGHGFMRAITVLLQGGCISRNWKRRESKNGSASGPLFHYIRLKAPERKRGGNRMRRVQCTSSLANT